MKPSEYFETERLLLRPPSVTDAESVFRAYAQDPEVTRYLTWRQHKSITETEEFLSTCVAAWRGDKRFPYAIVFKGKDDVVGMIEITIVNFKAEVGYVLARQFWRKGIMTEAVRRLVEWALSQPEIYRVWAVCDVENIASARVLEKAGMQREGILRRFILHPNVSDKPRDCFCYAVVKVI